MTEHLCTMPYMTLAEAQAVITALSLASDVMRQEPDECRVHVRLHAGSAECVIHRGKGRSEITIQHRVWA